MKINAVGLVENRLVAYCVRVVSLLHATVRRGG